MPRVTTTPSDIAFIWTGAKGEPVLSVDGARLQAACLCHQRSPTSPTFDHCSTSSMPPRKMHADELDTDVALVARLLTQQFPHWADLPIERGAPDGHGQRALPARRRHRSAAGFLAGRRTASSLEKERRWLPMLAPLLPLRRPGPASRRRPATAAIFWGICFSF